jgi:ComF family protein
LKTLFISLIKSIVRDIRQVLLPRMCIICDKRLQIDEHLICTGCLTKLPYTCYRGQAENGAVRLFYGEVEIERGNAYLYYYTGADSRKILFALKYHKQPQIGLLFGRMMAQDLFSTDFFNGIDALVPVPLAPRRQRQRGYNQSEWLAKGISQTTGLPVWTDVVKRIVENPTQTHLNHAQRRRNVEGIFLCVNPEKLQNKHILVIDDVVTTGATLISCMHSMQNVPGIKFSMLTLAQTASPTSLPGHVVPDFDI